MIFRLLPHRRAVAMAIRVRSLLWSRCTCAARSQDAVSQLRLLADQTVKERGDLVDVIRAELDSELALPIAAIDLSQVPDLVWK